MRFTEPCFRLGPSQSPSPLVIALDSYAEYSASRTGCHIWGIGTYQEGCPRQAEKPFQILTYCWKVPEKSLPREELKTAL
jgi:hypothetical protein